MYISNRNTLREDMHNNGKTNMPNTWINIIYSNHLHVHADESHAAQELLFATCLACSGHLIHHVTGIELVVFFSQYQITSKYFIIFLIDKNQSILLSYIGMWVDQSIWSKPHTPWCHRVPYLRYDTTCTCGCIEVSVREWNATCNSVICGPILYHCMSHMKLSLTYGMQNHIIHLKCFRTAAGVKSLYHACVDYVAKWFELYQPLLQQLLPLPIQTDVCRERDKRAYLQVAHLLWLSTFSIYLFVGTVIIVESQTALKITIINTQCI